MGPTVACDTVGVRGPASSEQTLTSDINEGLQEILQQRLVIGAEPDRLGTQATAPLPCAKGDSNSVDRL